MHGTAILQEDWTGPILTSEVFGGQQQQLLQFGLIFSLCWFLFMLHREFRSGGSLPRLLYLLQLGVMVGAAFVLDPFRFLVLWTLQHWMSAVGLVSFLGGNDISSRQTEGSSHSRILYIRSRVGVLILLGLVSLPYDPDDGNRGTLCRQCLQRKVVARMVGMDPAAKLGSAGDGHWIFKWIHPLPDGPCGL